LLHFGVFESVIVVAVQNTFRSEMHQNNIYFIIFLKFIFDIKTIQKYKKINFKQKQIFKLFKNIILTTFPNIGL
jgi:hypothetical protein